MLEFCPMCRGLLQLKKEGEKTIGVCSCGFKRTSGIIISGEDNSAKHAIVGEGVASNDFSSAFDRICRKCGHEKCEVTEMAANEAAIFIYRCLKCGFSERETQGSSKA